MSLTVTLAVLTRLWRLALLGPALPPLCCRSCNGLGSSSRTTAATKPVCLDHLSLPSLRLQTVPSVRYLLTFRTLHSCLVSSSGPIQTLKHWFRGRYLLESQDLKAIFMQQMQAVCGLESPYPFLLLIHGTHMLQTVLASLILIHLSHLLEV